MNNLTYHRIINKVYKGIRYVPTLSNDGHHVSTYVLRDKITGRFVSKDVVKSKHLKKCEYKIFITNTDETRSLWGWATNDCGMIKALRAALDYYKDNIVVEVERKIPLTDGN